jgi:hypothetical protein
VRKQRRVGRAGGGLMGLNGSRGLAVHRRVSGHLTIVRASDDEGGRRFENGEADEAEEDEDEEQR